MTTSVYTSKLPLYTSIDPYTAAIPKRPLVDDSIIASANYQDCMKTNSFKKESVEDCCISSSTKVIEKQQTDEEMLVKKSIETRDDSFLQPISETIVILLSTSIKHLLTVIPDSGEIALTQSGVLLIEKVKHFFHFVRQYSNLTTGEIIHIAIMLTRLLTHEAEQIRQGKMTIVSEANLGTLLLCATLIVVKMERDVPYRNSWWAKMFGVPLHILNQSEMIFLQKVDYNCDVSVDEYLDWYKKFILNIDEGVE
ncbi:uncharacterized protein MONOS_1936 [Monocercomonoides exilis]|uniref:uncharacterized protein n=1 Tax=Monocercomonoides exilis TaxID=2049356 RepID=UPI00355A4BE6|nr:hypothetical protein MONOS_1936 [Monocercomonoides exilis]|eukprot:MONOS_1936.1-p1 / transcript=MONOS_1936.1 / gene=MONOS_1936 / organism=Monocercomonoides_exilis_PA203 / gene_product=unspecified product / transcript_product=unspecified product / location=Mono_scaffold00037:66695-67554(+) / protein_length=252 / sequence_SO=supercontig / SO=protein_coding / is_pseudo=false